MANVCVITGGGSVMGLEAAKFMPKDKIIVLAGRTESKLQKAAAMLGELGFTAHAKVCDTSKRESVKALAEFASSLGEVKNVINSAGLSPAMADPETIVRVNALGTVYMNEEFSKVMNPGSVIGPHTNIYPLSSVRGVIPPNHIYKNAGEIVEKTLYENGTL